ncbi:hypothetical protein [Amycolatopsis nigrescens]|uniref:hypothetical protein n=1 Tax=Amycolatopsis nigrescens TaxID=381445 RepID=UPI00038073ED|nr:hypothetical protein [Amycolatopsis nigrescens]
MTTSGATISELNPQQALDQLVMVGTTSFYWPEDEDACDRHGKLLRDLLCGAEHGVAAFTRVERPESVKADSGGVHLSSVGTESVKWVSAAYGGAEPAIDELVQELRGECDRRRREQVQTADPPVFRHRLFLDAEAFASVVREAGQIRHFFALIDFQFHTMLDVPVLQASVSTWSKPPRSVNHMPDWLEGEFENSARVENPAAFAKAARKQIYDRICFRVETSGLRYARPRVSGRHYQSPIFWIAVPHASEPVLQVAGAAAPHLGGTVRELLSPATVADPPIISAMLSEDLRIFRRFVPEKNQDVPTYVLSPLPLLEEDTDVRKKVAIRRENEIRDMVTSLTKLEIDAAAALFELEKDVEIWHNHLQVYEAVTHTGGQLWDGVATHLLCHHRGRKSTRVQGLVQLLHQTLLQGIAALNNITTSVILCTSRIEKVSDKLWSDFTRAVANTQNPQYENLRDELTSAGLFRQIQRRVDEVKDKAEQVRANSGDLLTAIGQAYDERRVREGDRIQQSGTYLAGFLGVLGLVAVLDASFDQWKAPTAGWGQWALRGTSWGVGLFLLIMVGGFYVQRRRIGGLGSKRYRRAYLDVWDFLRRCSTERLDASNEEFRQTPRSLRAETWKGGGG